MNRGKLKQVWGVQFQKVQFKGIEPFKTINHDGRGLRLGLHPRYSIRSSTKAKEPYKASKKTSIQHHAIEGYVDTKRAERMASSVEDRGDRVCRYYR